MTTPAVISGTFSDLKSVKTRSIVQMIIEVPIENAASIIDAFGFPQPGNEIHVAVARLNPAASDRAAGVEQPEPGTKTRSRAQMAGILCNDPVFGAFLREQFGGEIYDADDAAKEVRSICNVGSRCDLDTHQAAGLRWEALRGQFMAWKALENAA